MDTPTDKVTTEEIRLFCGIDRQLYTFLVRGLCRNPLESLQIMAFWLWLERLGICKVISTILALSPSGISLLAEEAMACLNCMKNCLQPEAAGSDELVPLTQCLINKNITLQFFYDHKKVILKQILYLLKEVYVPALSDIVEAAQRGSGESSSQNMRSQGPTSVGYQPRTPRSFEEPLAANFSALNICENPSPAHGPRPAHDRAPTPAFAPARARAPTLGRAPMPPSTPTPALAPIPVPVRAPTPALAPIPVPARASTPAQAPIPAPIRNRARESQISEFTRTMFATFSKGYRVTEGEVRNYFTMLLGDCIESLQMQEVLPHQQPLYARIVFKNSYFVHRILKGGTKAKFSINGKHIWMRRFVTREGHTMTCGCPSIGPSVCLHHHHEY